MGWHMGLSLRSDTITQQGPPPQGGSGLHTTPGPTHSVLVMPRCPGPPHLPSLKCRSGSLGCWWGGPRAEGPRCFQDQSQVHVSIAFPTYCN